MGVMGIWCILRRIWPHSRCKALYRSGNRPKSFAVEVEIHYFDRKVPYLYDSSVLEDEGFRTRV